MLATAGYFTRASSYLITNFSTNVPSGLGTFPVLESTIDGKFDLAKLDAFLTAAKNDNCDA